MVHQRPRRDVRDAAQGLPVVEPALQTGRAGIRELEVRGPDARFRGRDPAIYPTRIAVSTSEIRPPLPPLFFSTLPADTHKIARRKGASHRPHGTGRDRMGLTHARPEPGAAHPRPRI